MKHPSVRVIRSSRLSRLSIVRCDLQLHSTNHQLMDWLHVLDDDERPPPDYTHLVGLDSPRATIVQIILATSFGLLAFLTFCILRPRWPSLYAARKKQKDAATILPELPTSLFGWIPTLWSITDQQVLASGGLDAYVFLDFFKMAAQFLTITLFFSLIIIKPVHDAFPDDDPKDNKTINGSWYSASYSNGRHLPVSLDAPKNGTHPPFFPDLETDYLWMYIVFAYLFSGVAIWLLVTHTRKIIQIRQEYLGAQTTITDRTIRLSGIPKYLRDEQKIKEFIEGLDIGKVESVMLCCNWKELDVAMKDRMDVLRRLELAYTIFAGQNEVDRNGDTLPVSQPLPASRLIDVDTDGPEPDEESGLLPANGEAVIPDKPRPLVTLRFGRFKLETRKVDAIDYYSERLRNLDARITELRQKRFETTPLAFVTMDSVAATQMAVQAVLDPSPLQLIASYSPPPSEVIWTNTYQTRRTRMLKAWVITVVIVLFTIFWSALLVPIAGLLNTEAIGRVFPQLADLLEQHENIELLVNTQLPVLIVTILVVLVPYIYYWMSWYQGFISVGEIELSAISKNFFFTFFNFFLVFTVLGTASEFIKYLEEFGKALEGFHNIAYTLALSLQRHLRFYCNYIILQSLTLHPLRLLELGSVALYPIYLIGAKTPRDYAELVQPPFFSYGFYLPNALLIFIICMVYCIFRQSWTVQLAGFSYFVFGHFVYKYQLLYAMDHSPHSTGKAWGMICDRIFVGMVFFQLTTAGQLILKNALRRAATMVPLIIATIWFSIVFGRTYKPLLRFIALQNIKKAQHEDYSAPDDPLPGALVEPEQNVWADPDVDQWRYYRESNSNSPSPPELVRFVNPSLVSPLRGVWLANKNFADGILGTSGGDSDSAQAPTMLRRPPFIKDSLSLTIA